MKATALIREAIASARGQRVASMMVALIVASMCVATLLTVGRTAAAEAQVQSRLEQAGSRRIEIRDVARRGFITANTVNIVSGYNTAERAIGVSGPDATTNSHIGPGATSVPAWTIQGAERSVATLTAGRWPTTGEALVSETQTGKLGMDVPVGGLLVTDTGERVSVVGSYRPKPGFEEFATGALIRATPDEPSDTLVIIATRASASPSLQAAALALLARSDPNDVSVKSPATLASLQGVVLDDLSFNNRWLILLILGTGAFLTAIIVLGGVLIGRADLGRRRALGASRSVLTSLVVIRTGFISGMAVLVGTLLGTAIAAQQGQRPGTDFVVAVALLTLIAAVVSAIVPSLIAAWQDPLKVLRTP